jgi:VWFA-related protein
MQVHPKWSVSAALVAVGTCAVIAQTPAAPQQGARFTTAVDFVRQIVTARDAKTGQFLPDLKRDDFVLLEDGVRQDIQSFVLVHGGRSLSDVVPTSVAPPAGIILPAVRPPADTSGRIIFIFVDDLHIEFKLTPRVRQMLKELSHTLIHDGDMFAIVSTGYSSIAQDPTYDRKRIPEIIEKVSCSGFAPAQIVAAAATESGPAEVRYRANTAFSTAYDLLRQLEAVPDRQKTFIYISSGYDFNPFPEARQRADAERNSRNPSNVAGQTDPNAVDPSLLSNPFDSRNTEFSFADLAHEVSELTREAVRANVNIYTADPRGLDAGPDIDEREVRTAEYQEHVRTSQNSLREIANPTGGFAIVNRNDFNKSFKQIDAETSAYYVLGYYSNNADPLKRVRKIEIKVNRPGIQLNYRPQYALRPGNG